MTQHVKIEEFNPKKKADVHFNKDSFIVNRLHHIGGTVVQVKEIGHQRITSQ